MTETPYSYVFVRRDVEWPYSAVQIAHACQHAGNLWMFPADTHLVLLSAKNGRDLTRIESRLASAGVASCSFYEPDFPRGTWAMCTEPVYGDTRRLFEKYELVEGGKSPYTWKKAEVKSYTKPSKSMKRRSASCRVVELLQKIYKNL